MVRSTGVQEPQRLPWLPTHRTLAGTGAAVEIAPGQGDRPLEQGLVARPQLAVLVVEALEHRGDPAALLGAGHAGRDEHHRAVAVAVGRDRAPAARAAAHLDERLGVG